jgi:hypothetical protein
MVALQNDTRRDVVLDRLEEELEAMRSRRR